MRKVPPASLQWCGVASFEVTAALAVTSCTCSCDGRVRRNTTSHGKYCFKPHTNSLSLTACEQCYPPTVYFKEPGSSTTSPTKRVTSSVVCLDADNPGLGQWHGRCKVSSSCLDGKHVCSHCYCGYIVEDEPTHCIISVPRPE